MIDKPGIYVISNEEYHSKDICAEPVLSRSVIHELIYKSPAHVWFNHPRLNPEYKEEEAKEKYDIGTAAHSLLLEGTNVAVMINAEDWKKKETKELRDAARAEGKTPLLKDDYIHCFAMIAAAERQLRECEELKVKSLRDEGDSELTYIFKEGDTWLKVRPDWVSKDRKLIIDYKTTTRSAHPREWGRSIEDNAYDIQSALYRNGVKAIDGTSPKFVFMVQETFPPYLCAFNALPPVYAEMGDQKCNYGGFVWRECIKKGYWPGYSNRVYWIEPEPWRLAKWEELAADIGYE